MIWKMRREKKYFSFITTVLQCFVSSVQYEATITSNTTNTNNDNTIITSDNDGEDNSVDNKPDNNEIISFHQHKFTLLDKCKWEGYSRGQVSSVVVPSAWHSYKLRWVISVFSIVLLKYPVVNVVQTYMCMAVCTAGRSHIDDWMSIYVFLYTYNRTGVHIYLFVRMHVCLYVYII